MRINHMANAHPQISNWDGLLQLAAQVMHQEPGGPRSPNFLADANRFEKTCKSESRRTIQRLIRSGVCCACGIPVDELASGDHVVPTTAGGHSGIENFLPMCVPCNASKGKRDLLVWTASKDRTLRQLGPDAIIIYIRNVRPIIEANGELDLPAETYLITLLAEFADTLPSLAMRYFFKTLAATQLVPEAAVEAVSRTSGAEARSLAWLRWRQAVYQDGFAGTFSEFESADQEVGKCPN